MQESLKQSISNLNLNINVEPKDAEITKRKIENIDWKYDMTKQKLFRNFKSKHLIMAVYHSQDIQVSKNTA